MKNEFLIKTYGKMAIALSITAITAYCGYLNYLNNPINGLTASLITGMGPFVICFIQLTVAISMGVLINRMSASMINFCYVCYSVLTGITMSTVPLVYGADTIFVAIAFTAVFFVILTIFGMTTKADLSKWSTVLIAGLLALILMGIVGLFWHNEVFYQAYNYIGVLLFVAYVAYDAQMIKRLCYYRNDDKISTYAALNLYLDAINLFLRMLRIMDNEN